MPARCHPSGKKGAALFLVLVIVTFLSSFGGVLAVLAHNRYLLTQLEIDRVKAISLAEAGIAQAIHELKTQKDEDGNGLGNISIRNLGEGSFSVIHKSKTSEIRSTGLVNGVRRTLQVRYALN